MKFLLCIYLKEINKIVSYSFILLNNLSIFFLATL